VRNGSPGFFFFLSRAVTETEVVQDRETRPLAMPDSPGVVTHSGDHRNPGKLAPMMTRVHQEVRRRTPHAARLADRKGRPLEGSHLGAVGLFGNELPNVCS